MFHIEFLTPLLGCSTLNFRHLYSKCSTLNFNKTRQADYRLRTPFFRYVMQHYWVIGFRRFGETVLYYSRVQRSDISDKYTSLFKAVSGIKEHGDRAKFVFSLWSEDSE